MLNKIIVENFLDSYKNFMADIKKELLSYMQWHNDNIEEDFDLENIKKNGEYCFSFTNQENIIIVKFYDLWHEEFKEFIPLEVVYDPFYKDNLLKQKEEKERLRKIFREKCEERKKMMK